MGSVGESHRDLEREARSRPGDWWCRHPVLSFLLVFVAVFLVRSLFTTWPEMEDALKKWKVAVSLAATHDPAWLLSRDHHSARWAINLPIAASIKVFGPNLTAYFVPVLCMYAFFFAFMLVVAREHFNKWLLGAFAIILFYEPMFFRATSQIQPFIFGVFYLSCALWLYQRYQVRSSITLLCLSALFAFFTYGAKETYLFFVFGLGILILWRSGFRCALIFASCLLGLLALETLAFNWISGELMFGRIQYLAEGKHLKDLKPVSYSALEFVTRKWLIISDFNTFVSLIGIGFSFWIIATGRMSQLKTLTAGIILMTLSYSVLVSILPKSLDPLIPIQPNKAKYMTPIMPWMVFIGVLCLSFIVNRCDRLPRKLMLIVANLTAAGFLCFNLMIGPVFKYTIVTQVGKTRHPAPEGWLWKYRDLEHALMNGWGVCARKTIRLNYVQWYFQEFMHENKLVNHLELKNMGEYRLLYTRGYNPEALNGYIHQSNLLESVDKSRCLRF